MVEELSYSLHLSNDKNKTKRARKFSKENDNKQTSFGNNAIQNLRQLSKADKHNLRKYDDNQELICIIKGSSSIVEDTKKLYLDLFENARIKYNENQTRNDRKIENYFEHISNDNKHDLACEIIIELGDMDFWEDKKDDFKRKMIDVYKEQINDLESIVPNFKVANATIHFDESSPHLHIIGVPIKDGNKNGMEKQVGKSDVFTKESLSSIQDQMRNKCINSFNTTYKLDYILKEKDDGRNYDISVNNMNNYKQLKKEQEKYKKRLKELNNKANELKNKSNEITNIVDNLKPNRLNKNNYSISNEEIIEIKKYIEQTNETTSNLKDTNDLTTMIEKYDDDLKTHKHDVELLQRKIKARDNRIEELKDNLEAANETIDELEEQVSLLKKIVEFFEKLWEKFIEFLQNKFFKSNKYDSFIEELYQADILNNEDLLKIKNENIEKDDFER